MSEGSLSIVLDRPAFEPGETLRGSYQVVMAELSRLDEVEVTIGWHTEGKGLEARGVEHHEVQRAGKGSLDRNGSGKFSAVLPASPLSYNGVLIKVCWAVRVCASVSGGGDMKSEEAFQLGHVASVVTDSSAMVTTDYRFRSGRVPFFRFSGYH
ncbi:MAG: hypothetical protein ACHRXM_01700 [Isosphaerales bacterium]